MNKKLKQIHEKLNNLVNKLNEWFKAVYDFCFNTKKGKIIFYTLGILLVFTYLILYFFKQPIVDEEVRIDSMNNLIPWEIKSGENVVSNLITRPFNLNITELGQYRPRYLAFFIQCLEENIFLKLVRAVPEFGNRAPFYPVAMVLTVLSIAYFIKIIWKKMPNSFAFFVASFIPLFQNYQITTYLRARSAKLFTVSACVFLLAYCIKKLEEKFELKKAYKALIGVLIFPLMTLDEQVLALVAILTFCSILIAIINKKVNLSSVVYLIASGLYATYYLWWGKALFSHFTGGLTTHGHTIEGAISTLGIGIFFKVIKLLFNIVIPKIVFLSGIAFVIFWIYFFLKIKKEKTKESIKENLIGLGLLAIPIVIMMMLLAGHKAIYDLECLWRSVYTLNTGILLFLSFIYVIGKSETKIENIKPFILTFGLLVALVYNISNLDSYYMNYLTEKGALFTYVTDMEVTENDIIIDVTKQEEMQYLNGSIIASMNTMFTTSDFTTAKKVHGEIEKTNEEYYITDVYSCYLIAQKYRKLKIKAQIEEFELYNSVSIIVNKLEIANIDINDKDFEVELDIKLERYRAGKITLVFHKNEITYDNQKHVNLENLYMY